MAVSSSEEDAAPALGEMAVSALVRAMVLGAFFALYSVAWVLPPVSFSAPAPKWVFWRAAYGALFGLVSVPAALVELNAGSYRQSLRRDIVASAAAGAFVGVARLLWDSEIAFVTEMGEGHGFERALARSEFVTRMMLASWPQNVTPYIMAFAALTMVRLRKVGIVPGVMLVTVATAAVSVLREGMLSLAHEAMSVEDHVQAIMWPSIQAMILVPCCALADLLELRFSSWIERRRAAAERV